MKNKLDFSKLKELSAQELILLGLSRWQLNHGTVYLFPKSFYDQIPDGFEVTDIRGETKSFKHGETDDDTRFGYLAFGIFKEE